MNVTIALLLMAQVSAPGPENWSYLTCLIDSSSAFLSRSPSRAEYHRHLAQTCPNERAAIRRVVIERQKAKGQSAQQAEREANDFVATVQDQMRDLQPVGAR